MTVSKAGARLSDYMEAMQLWGRFVERGPAETNPSLKQIIPYCVLCSRDRVFLMRRRAGGGEQRLHDKLSLGVGGHINPVDSAGPTDSEGHDAVATLHRGLLRELHEELWIEAPPQPVCLGVLNDDSNEVGQVHLGIVFRLDVEDSDVRVREHDSLEGSFVTVTELNAVRSRLETWSQLVAATLWPTSPS